MAIEREVSVFRLLREFCILGSGNVFCVFVNESVAGWCSQKKVFVWIDLDFCNILFDLPQL